VRCLAQLVCCLCGCCRRRPRARRAKESPAAVMLDEGSESEAEEEDSPCQAVQVGIACEGATRALAADGCDEAAPGKRDCLASGEHEGLWLSAVRGKEDGLRQALPSPRSSLQGSALQKQMLPCHLFPTGAERTYRHTPLPRASRGEAGCG